MKINSNVFHDYLQLLLLPVLRHGQTTKELKIAALMKLRLTHKD